MCRRESEGLPTQITVWISVKKRLALSPQQIIATLLESLGTRGHPARLKKWKKKGNVPLHALTASIFFFSIFFVPLRQVDQ